AEETPERSGQGLLVARRHEEGRGAFALAHELAVGGDRRDDGRRPRGEGLEERVREPLGLGGEREDGRRAQELGDVGPRAQKGDALFEPELARERLELALEGPRAGEGEARLLEFARDLPESSQKNVEAFL